MEPRHGDWPRPKPKRVLRGAEVITAQPGSGPTVLRILLGSQLRLLREVKGITREEAGYAIRASGSKISRMELGRVSFKERDVTDLLKLYGVDEDETATLVALAIQANSPGWWHKYGDVLPDWFQVYVGLEEAASLIRLYEVQFVPGLLQTADYARAVVRLGQPGAAPEEIERRISLRMGRQELLTKPGGPRLWAIVDEAALRRPIGGAAVMRAQVEHLLEITQLRHVNVQVLPFRAGGHRAGGGPVTLLRFAGDNLPDVAYLEQLNSAVYPSSPSDLACYRDVLNQLATEADPPIASTTFLNQIRNQL